MVLLKGVAEMMFGRRVFNSETGLLGLAPKKIMSGMLYQFSSAASVQKF